MSEHRRGPDGVCLDCGLANSECGHRPCEPQDLTLCELPCGGHDICEPWVRERVRNALRLHRKTARVDELVDALRDVLGVARDTMRFIESKGKDGAWIAMPVVIKKYEELLKAMPADKPSTGGEGEV